MAAARIHGYRNKRQFETENKARKTSSMCWKLIPSSLLLGKLALYYELQLQEIGSVNKTMKLYTIPSELGTIVQRA